MTVPATARPAAKRSIPAVTTRRVPKRATSHEDSGAQTIIAAAYGRTRTPGLHRREAEDELQVLRREEEEPEEGEEEHHDGAARGAEARVLEQPHVEQRRRGAALVHGERRQRDRRERAGAEDAADVQPCAGASMTAQTRATSPAPESAAPVQSTGRAAGSRDSGRSRRPATRASAVSGTLTRKIEPHPKWSSSTPPATGPSATPTPAVAAQMPIAVARSRGSVKTLMRSESVAGMMNAAPAPMTARAAISASTPPA